MGKTSDGSNRESWGSKWGPILACIGSTVGMGNIWLFPSRVANYGGVFLAAYFIFDIFIGLSGVIGEMNLGRKAKEGPVSAFRQACASRGKGNTGALIGGVPMAEALMLAIGYSVVMGWIFRYVLNVFAGKALSYGANVSDTSGHKQAFGATTFPSGNSFWPIIALAVIFAIMVLGVTGGIEKANKIMIPLFFLPFIGLVVYTYF